MAAAKKKQSIDSQLIITKYMEYVLEHEIYPTSTYKFCKIAEIKEEEFYKFFGSLDHIKKTIWTTFFAKTLEVMLVSEDYEALSSKEKMLTFFYTFFEMLTLNRSYVLFSLAYEKMPLKNLAQLKGLRSEIKEFAKTLATADNEEKGFKITKNPVPLYTEGAWVQFLFILKFWKEDTSPSFEKTDIVIEKSVHTIFDVLDNTPLDSVLDFGKFLWKEKTMWN